MRVRFDDTLGTALATDLTTAPAAQAAWRQIVDLVGRRRAPADAATLSLLADIRDRVPLAARAASARALFGARPPAALVRLMALDDIAVAAPVLRGAELDADDWIALLPALSPVARAVLRHRRDLPPAAIRALASFGTVDFVIGADDAIVSPVSTAAGDEVLAPMPAAAVAERQPVDSGPFLSVGSIALGLPVVAEALRRENDNEAPSGEDGTFRIADVVAKLEAFQRRKDAAGAVEMPVVPVPQTRVEGFRFETDSAGTVRWVDGIARGAIVGLDLRRQARPAEPGVDGIAAGAFRRRARFADAHLVLAGAGPAAGTWLMSAVPVFDPATGRFSGYRGSGRRPMRHERAEAPADASPPSDSLRQLVHELRTPTNAIAGFSEMIEHQMLGPVAPGYRGHAATMRADAGGLLAAIDDLDTAARIDGGALQLRPEPIAPGALLDRIAADLAPLAHARGARLTIARDDDTTLIADARALERLITRLLGAMVGAAGAGEAIAVRGFAAATGRIGLAVTRPTSLDSHPGDAVLAIDDEDSPATLLGIGFTLRLARNLARELGGMLTIGQRSLTLYLPGAVDRVVEQARTH